MYSIVFFRDSNGNEPVADFVKKSRKTPASEIKRAKAELACFLEEQADEK